MSRFLLSAVSIFVLLFTTFLLPRSASARRCEERMPLTLLSLYRTSDAIYAGRFEKIEDGEVTEDTEDYRAVPIKKHFTITSAFKGESRKLLTLEDTEYRYKNQGADEETDHEDGEILFEAKPGDLVLLFVSKNKESGAIEPTEAYDGVKKMTPEKLSVYESRIRELKGILNAEKPKYSRLVEWMIRCAEDPLTRWEGTFELLQSFQNMEWQDERAKQAKEKPAGAEDAAESEDYVPEVPKEFETGDPGFAKSLTDAQKGALTSILINRERSKKTESDDDGASMASGDRELIELVKRWGDSNAASSLLEQLRYDASDTNLTSELMASIALMLKDDELIVLSDEYSSIQWEADDGFEGQYDVETPEPAVEGSEAVILPVATEAELAVEQPMQPEPVDQVPVEVPEAQPGKKKTYGERREELTAEFVVRAGKLIASERNKDTAKLNR